jgi:Protein of unknown function DUF262
MSFQAPISVSDVVSRIRERRLLLPAIQREFVWGPKKVEWLFDSLLQGYPIGSFLFWEVRDDGSKREPYYEFLREFRERYRTHNPEFNAKGHFDFDVVLDGQQRLTALYIGLTGTYAYKKPRLWWEDSEHALPTRRLYLNTEGPAPEDDEEAGRIYEFRFLTEAEYLQAKAQWFRMDQMLDLADAYDLNKMLTQQYQQNEFAARALSRLHSVVHVDRIINYYSVKKADMEGALNVFVRVNSGGEPLSLSDMLMSTAIANWKIRDARKEISGLVDEIQAKGFFIDKDLILKACLYLYSSDIRYKVSNFKAARVKPFEDNWDTIHNSILAVFGLVRDFGYNQTSLTSKNALLPIIYWVHHKGLSEGITSQVALRNERGAILRWLHTVLLKGVFGSAADTILAAIRRAFVGEEFKAPFIKTGIDCFPAEAIATIIRTQGKDPQVTDEFIDALLSTQYDEKEAFTILALLSPNLDYKNGNFHKDHLHPASAFRKRQLQSAGVADGNLSFYQSPVNWNSIVNLSHLDGNENKAKQDKSLLDWVSSEAAQQKVTLTKFCNDHLLPNDPAVLDFSRFPDFVGERRKILGQRLQELLSV